MATKLRALKINEMSLVDRPANVGARVVLVKRDAGHVRKDMYGVSRFADLLSSLCYLLQSSQSEAEFEGDGSLVPEALRTWLRSGTSIFRNMATEEVDELISSLVAKREFTAEQRQAAASSGAAMSDGSFPIENASDLRNAMRAIGRAKDPAKAKAHIRARAKTLGLSSELSDAFKGEGMLSKFIGLFKSVDKATGALADSVKSIVADKGATNKDALVAETLKQFSEHVEDVLDKALTTGVVVDTSEEDDMSAALKKALGLADAATEAEVLAALAKKDEAIAKAALDLEVAKADMSEDEKTFHDGLKSDDERKAFRGGPKGDRSKAMAKRDDIPEYVRKQLEEAEDVKKRLAVLEDERELAIFKAKARDLGLPEKDGEILMKAKRGDKASIDALIDLVGKANAALDTSVVFAEFGTTKGATGDAFDQLQAKADELRKSQPSLTKEQAFAKVYEDPSNVELVKAERRANRPAAA